MWNSRGFKSKSNNFYLWTSKYIQRKNEELILNDSATKLKSIYSVVRSNIKNIFDQKNGTDTKKWFDDCYPGSVVC